MSLARHTAARAAVARWNYRHPIGTAVSVALKDGSTVQTVTTSAASLVSDWPMIEVANMNGRQSLWRVTPVEELGEKAGQ